MNTPRQRVSSGSPYEPVIGFSRALRVGNRVVVSGTAPVWPDGSCDPDPAAQARRCLEIIVAALEEAGARPEHVVRTRIYLRDAGDWEAIGQRARRRVSRRQTSEHDATRRRVSRPALEGGDRGGGPDRLTAPLRGPRRTTVKVLAARSIPEVHETLPCRKRLRLGVRQEIDFGKYSQRIIM